MARATELCQYFVLTLSLYICNNSVEWPAGHLMLILHNEVKSFLYFTVTSETLL